MKPIDYQLIRSKRKTITLTVGKNGEIILRVPNGYPSARADEFVIRHSEWIERQRMIVATRPKLDLSDGAELNLFGEPFRIGTGRTRLTEKILFLPETGREEALKSLLKKLSERKMSALTEKIAEKFGFSYKRVRISSARGRWGSCNREGVIAYTFRIAFLPRPLAEYVAVHELVHTVWFDHSPDFWREVERVLPDWKLRRKALKSNASIGFL